jgi:hypothetical protein
MMYGFVAVSSMPVPIIAFHLSQISRDDPHKDGLQLDDHSLQCQTVEIDLTT